MKRPHHVSVEQLLAFDRFPRITPDEEFLLRDWLLSAGAGYDEVSVDVPLGPGQQAAPTFAAAFDRMWTAITRRRADLIALRGDRADVVEAKLHATAPTATQVLRYCELFRAEHPHVTRVRPVVVCRSASPSMAGLMRHHGGELVVVPQRFPNVSVFPFLDEQELPHDC